MASYDWSFFFTGSGAVKFDLKNCLGIMVPLNNQQVRVKTAL